MCQSKLLDYSSILKGLYTCIYKEKIQVLTVSSEVIRIYINYEWMVAHHISQVHKVPTLVVSVSNHLKKVSSGPNQALLDKSLVKSLSATNTIRLFPELDILN